MERALVVFLKVSNKKHYQHASETETERVSIDQTTTAHTEAT